MKLCGMTDGYLCGCDGYVQCSYGIDWIWILLLLAGIVMHVYWHQFKLALLNVGHDQFLLITLISLF